MNSILDLTRDRFDSADFCEADLLFESVHRFEPCLRFRLWGATLRTNRRRPNAIQFPEGAQRLEDDMHIAGYAETCLADVCGGSIRVTPYDPETDPPFDDFCRTRKGTLLEFTRDWP